MAILIKHMSTLWIWPTNATLFDTKTWTTRSFLTRLKLYVDLQTKTEIFKYIYRIQISLWKWAQGHRVIPVPQPSIKIIHKTPLNIRLHIVVPALLLITPVNLKNSKSEGVQLKKILFHQRGSPTALNSFLCEWPPHAALAIYSVHTTNSSFS